MAGPKQRGSYRGPKFEKDAFAHIKPGIVNKGSAEQLHIAPWVTRDGALFLSFGIADLGEDGKYDFYRRKGFALTPAEARQTLEEAIRVLEEIEQVVETDGNQAETETPES